ncbi:flavin monoamine oxidase family protein [Carnobacterium maltaromaticum]|uniref:flavin monoamine oxidase family protein n=1 Tax=Carnobacterium maltaromaticum TaxID=2751 RepID=UPI0012F91413|nr:FAD-dependent oxidoreductase [Carnobacterium maltaromaticum]
MIRTQDVVVIGAGFSGLAAGLKLKELGISSVILEARDRVGGRTKTDYLPDGTQIDIGGQWIGPTQDRMYELVEKYGVKTFNTIAEGAATIQIETGKIDNTLPEEVNHLLGKVDKLSKGVNTDRPWETPEAGELDHQTFKTWMENNSDSNEAVTFVGRLLAGGLLSSGSGEVSALQMALYIATGNGVSVLLGMDGGAQQDRLIGGPHHLAKCMAEDYGLSDIYFNHAVKEIEYTENAVEVRTVNGECFKAKKVVLALPPVIANKITFEPALPLLKSRMLKQILPGSALKFHAIYSTPFWRERGISGVTNSNIGYITESVDNSLPMGEKGVISFFAYGDEANLLRAKGAAERKEVLLSDLADLLGSEAKTPESFIEFDWDNEPYTLGCFSGHFALGGIVNYGAILKEPVKSLHWAGTETSSVWNGYFEGAVHAGEREANKISELLSMDMSQ